MNWEIAWRRIFGDSDALEWNLNGKCNMNQKWFGWLRPSFCAHAVLFCEERTKKGEISHKIINVCIDHSSKNPSTPFQSPNNPMDAVAL